jgi:hypothetical protein
MEAGNALGSMCVNSTAATPDQINEQWLVSDNTAWVNAPKVRVRVCSSVEKHAAEQRVEQEQRQALEQAQQYRNSSCVAGLNPFTCTPAFTAAVDA